MTKYLMKMRRMAVLLSFLMVLSIMLTGFVWNEKNVVVIADGKEMPIKTHLNSPKGIIREAGIELGSKDAINLNTDSLQDGTVIRVVRAFPVTVAVGDKTQEVMTTQVTAEGLAKELGYDESKYVPVVNGEGSLQAGSSVRFAQITNRRVHSEVRSVPIETVRQADDKLFRGEEQLVQDGKVGAVKVIEEILYENGKEIARHNVSMDILEPMQARIIREGTRDFLETARGNVRFSHKMIMEASAYLPTDGDGRGITATGIRAVRGVVAVDPDVIPLGTKLFIPGYGMALAADTGGYIIGNRIDLLMEDYNEAIEFGRRDIEVYILKE